MSSNHVFIKNDPRWHSARAECLERDDYTCQDCGSNENLQADHIVSLEVLFADGATAEAIDAALDVDNLTTLCRPCNGRKGAGAGSSPIRNPWVHPRYPELDQIVLK